MGKQAQRGTELTQSHTGMELAFNLAVPYSRSTWLLVTVTHPPAHPDPQPLSWPLRSLEHYYSLWAAHTHPDMHPLARMQVADGSGSAFLRGPSKGCCLQFIQSHAYTLVYTHMHMHTHTHRARCCSCGPGSRLPALPSP